MTCQRTGHRCFKSKRHAKAAHRTASNKFRVYFCSGCHCYHVSGRVGGKYR